MIKDFFKGIIKFYLGLIVLILIGNQIGLLKGNGGKVTNRHNQKATGATCNDGFISNSTSYGTCSSHDGVRYWNFN